MASLSTLLVSSGALKLVQKQPLSHVCTEQQTGGSNQIPTRHLLQHRLASEHCPSLPSSVPVWALIWRIVCSCGLGTKAAVFVPAEQGKQTGERGSWEEVPDCPEELTWYQELHFFINSWAAHPTCLCCHLRLREHSAHTGCLGLGGTHPLTHTILPQFFALSKLQCVALSQQLRSGLQSLCPGTEKI